MRRPRYLLWLIIFLAISSLLIQLPLNNPFSNKFKFKKGLDLEGGTSITLLADMKDIPPDQRDNALESAKFVIERRINIFGVSEPLVQTAKAQDYRVIVELPGVPLNQALGLVGRTAKLEFREVVQATTSAFIPYENTNPTGLTGADLKDASPSFDSSTGKPVVSFRVADKSQDQFANVTQSLIGKPMVIYLDQQFISAPVVQSSIRDSGQITGNFTQEGTKQLADYLNAGALPIPFSILSSREVGPSLGQISLQKSLFAGGIGFIIVVLFMIFNYGKLGGIASLALTLYVLLVLSIFKLSSASPYGITLTLSGIAGFILSIGMAVDANILIFERMKEEERQGRGKENAIELGFSRAFPSIRDSNISSIITSAVLYEFGTGPVKGFALVLAIGVLVSMFSAIVVTRTLLRFIYR
ncbi:MAG TPA: protein translocase subunit SecD [Patescibacteria group bacterium]|nr:protein translocase subunit SecD [Patescibacteria group bacterium]